MSYPSNTTPDYGDEEALTLKKILKALDDAKTGDAPLIVADTGGAITPHEEMLGASESQVIPSGAKGYSYIILTGTATVGSAAGVPAGVAIGESRTLATSLTITTAAASSAFVAWNT